MSVPHAILGLVRDRPRHGYEIKRLVDRYVAPDHPVAYAQVYASLDRLERRGWLRVAGIERVDGPDRRRYAITDAGVEELERWLAEPLQPDARRQTAMYAKVVLAILARRPPGPIVAAERQACMERIGKLTERRRTATLPIDLLVDHALAHAEADLHWLDRLDGRLEELQRELTARSTSA